jgi:integrase
MLLGPHAGPSDLAGLHADMVLFGMSARACSTLRTHDTYWARFEDWCGHVGVAALPASELSVALYLTYMLQQGASAAMVQSASAAVACTHRLAGLDSPTESMWAANVREAARREAPAALRVKDSLSPTEIARIVTANVLQTAELHTQQKGVACLLMYAGLLRASDLLGVAWHTIEFNTEGMHLFIPKAKTDQLGKGRCVPIARTRDAFCPVGLTEAFLVAAGHSAAGPGPLIRVFGPSGRASSADAAPCYSTLSTWVISACVAAGIATSHIGTHSFRKSGATALANAGVSAGVLQAIGGWACPSVLDRYVTHGDASLFGASRSLSLANPSVGAEELAAANNRRRRQREA